ADTHAAQLGEAFADAALDDVLEVDDAEEPSVPDHGEGRAADLGDLAGDHLQLALALVAGARGAAGGGGELDVLEHRIDRALADRGAVEIDAAHAALGRERHEGSV